MFGFDWEVPLAFIIHPVQSTSWESEKLARERERYLEESNKS